MIEEVLAFSSLDEGRETVRPTDFLAADLDSRRRRGRRAAGAQQKHLASRPTFPTTPIRMTSDIDKVRQILVNLAGNAVKFTDAGEVARAARSERDRLGPYSTSSDTGIGIAHRRAARASSSPSRSSTPG